MSSNISPWDIPMTYVSNYSNLQCFLQCITPIVKKRMKTQNGKSEKDIISEGFSLEDVWESFSEWSAYGVAVPVLLNNGDHVVQYYSPSLSALQLYTTKPFSSSDKIDDKFRWRDEIDKTSSNKNGSCLTTNVTRDKDSCNIQITRDQCGYLYYQYNETESPYDRVPFKEKISELAKRNSGLVDFHTKDLSPYSWMAIAWYPVYQVPVAKNAKELSACFLTYHPLFSSQGPKNVTLEVEKIEGKILGKSLKEEMCLPPFAMVTYKMFGSLWINPETSDSDTVSCQRTAACYWLKQLQFHHHDFDFFMSRQFQNSQC